MAYLSDFKMFTVGVPHSLQLGQEKIMKLY